MSREKSSPRRKIAMQPRRDRTQDPGNYWLKETAKNSVRNSYILHDLFSRLGMLYTLPKLAAELGVDYHTLRQWIVTGRSRATALQAL
jgi:hypothetical protein